MNLKRNQRSKSFCFFWQHFPIAAAEKDAEIENARDVEDVALVDKTAVGFRCEKIPGRFLVRAQPQEHSVQRLQ
jgi:hypothetical protein